MTDEPQKLKVFLCHASENKPIVQGLYDRLSAAGFDPWLDSHFLLPGMEWDLEIQKAMRSSDAVIVFLSRISVDKEGYVQKEIKYAQEIQKEKPEGTIFLIPLQLEECKVPFRLSDVQWGHYFEANGFEKLAKALNVRAGQLKRILGVLSAPSFGGLPPGSYIPFPRNVLFTGREHDLEMLAEVLLTATPLGNSGQANAKGAKEKDKNLSELRALRGSKNTVITQAITGMGGIGKTQLAVEFAYRYGHHFKGAHWLDLRDPSQFETEIAKNGEKMLLQPWPEELPIQIAYTLNAWKTNGPRLLILDNFEEVGLAHAVLANFQHPSLRILVTSRRGDWPSNLGLQSLGLEVFTKEESLEFLDELLENREDRTEDVEHLAAHLGHLPLALELAGRYLGKHPRLSILGYLAQLENVLEHRSMGNWKPELKSATAHDLSLIQTFMLSWEQVGDENAQKAFIMAGFLAPNSAIPLEIFESALEVSQEICDETLEELYGLGLLRKLKDNSPAIHPLLAEFARRLDSENTNLSALSEKLAEIANARNHEVDRTGNYALYTPLLPHVRAVAEKAEMAQVEKAGNLWNSLGYHISDLADYTGAKAAYERALKIRQRAFGKEHPDVAQSLWWLGVIAQEEGNKKSAKEYYERALTIYRKFLPPEHITIKSVEGYLRALEEK
jgi:tetratricopeptide (TPR) repeat protein